MKASFKISSKDIINEYNSASSKSTVGKILGISYSKVVKTLLSAGIDIEDELADNIFDLKCQGFTNQEICKQYKYEGIKCSYTICKGCIWTTK